MPQILPGTEVYAGQHRAWNEVHCLSRAEFDRMAPRVVRLESARMSELETGLVSGSAAHATLVAARHHLERFGRALARGESAEDLARPLEAAILSLGLGARDHPASGALLSLADRLDYVLAQVRRLF